MKARTPAAAGLALVLAACASTGERGAPAAELGAPQAAPAPPQLEIETRYAKLPNGLRVVMSKDASVPTATVAVYYGIGFRIEPRDRTGFAHLFEHLMFQGSGNAPKGTFDNLIYRSGGVNNGSTRFDYTNYYEVVPSNALEAVLWIEADRMARPVINQEVLVNQQGVVANEVKVNVLNQPYGGWPWIDLPMLANENWYNSHNFYGELSDLEAATVEDAKQFFDQFYRPNNAVLVVAGDIDYDQTMAWVEKYFGAIAAGAPVTLPDISEPRQQQEKFRVRKDPLAPRPAYSFAYHMPERGSLEYYAMGLLDQILIQGADSRLNQKLVNERGVTGSVSGGINLLGNMFNYNGPMLWAGAFVHDPAASREAITAAIDEVIEDVRANGVTQAELDRARTKLRSDFYGVVDSGTRFGLVDLLGSFALFDDDPAKINEIETGFAQVTPELIKATAQEYLRPANRSVLVVEPAGPTAQQGKAQ